MSRKYPKLENFLICDDIRREPNNKVSVMGIYGPETVLPIPTVLPKLCFYLELSGMKDGDKLSIYLRDPKHGILNKLDTPEFKNPKGRKQNAILHIIFSGVQVSQEGLYRLVMSLAGDKKGEHVLEFELKK